MSISSRSGRLNPRIRQSAQKGVLTTVLRILHLAWPETAADSRITSDCDEDSITDILRWKMADAKNRLDPVPQMKFLREPQSDRAELDTPTGYIDIMVSYSWDESTYLTMECKRVKSTENSLALRYVRNGVNRFASGKYSPGHAYGVMLGYVICGNRNGCIDRVRTTLSQEPESETGFDSEFGWQSDLQLVNGIEHFKTRHHQQSHDNMIEIIHAFVVVN